MHKEIRKALHHRINQLAGEDGKPATKHRLRRLCSEFSAASGVQLVEVLDEVGRVSGWDFSEDIKRIVKFYS